jgi:tRNA(fMet)-specific endonuclease VapC
VSRYLLDTSIVCDLVRAPQGRVAARVADVGEARVCTSVIVAAELRFGGAKKGSARLTAQLEAVLGALDVLPLAPLPTRSTAPSAPRSSAAACPSVATTC